MSHHMHSLHFTAHADSGLSTTAVLPSDKREFSQIARGLPGEKPVRPSALVAADAQLAQLPAAHPRACTGPAAGQQLVKIDVV